MPILELVYLEPLVENEVDQFAFVGVSLTLRGAAPADALPLDLPPGQSAQ